MRSLTAHVVEGDSVNHQLEIMVLDEPGHGGACHEYSIGYQNRRLSDVQFQNGPIKEYGVNGLTHEALLAILIDRMDGFQSGPYASGDNEEARNHLELALRALQRRTKARIARGVEGTHAV